MTQPNDTKQVLTRDEYEQAFKRVLCCIGDELLSADTLDWPAITGRLGVKYREPDTLPEPVDAFSFRCPQGAYLFTRREEFTGKNEAVARELGSLFTGDAFAQEFAAALLMKAKEGKAEARSLEN